MVNKNFKLFGGVKFITLPHLSALLLAAQKNLPVFEYNPTEVKMALTGYGRAEKRQVQEMVKIILNLKSLKMSEDSTDALALCICHINSSTFKF